VSGKALAAGIAANPNDQESVASAIPLIYFSNDAYVVPDEFHAIIESCAANGTLARRASEESLACAVC
jgi:hypothetical protein